jgi:drug/metabolite transporter (DMT)-like permease
VNRQSLDNLAVRPAHGRLDPRHSFKLLLCLGTVYLVWGSSFLFSKIAVTHLPPALFGSLRFTTAGAILAAFARYWTGAPWPSPLPEWRHVLVMGFLMVFASSGLNIWAIQYIPSSESALLNGTAALWIAGLGVFGPRGHALSRRAVAGLAIGFTGTVLLLIPKGGITGQSMLAQGGALSACLAWSLGTLYYRSIDTTTSPLMFTALQLLVGGLLLGGLGLAHGDVAAWHWNGPGIIALVYLTTFSSCLAFTAYGWLTLNAAPTLIGTYSYVNPAIAAFLGWQFLDEHLSPSQLAGMIVILVGVVLLTLPGSSLLDPKNLEEPRAQ